MSDFTGKHRTRYGTKPGKIPLDESRSRAVVDMRYREAQDLMRVRRWQDALNLLDALADEDSTRVVVLLDLATCLIEVERDREALYVLAVNQNRLCHLSAYHLILARVAARHWKITQALESARQAIVIDPSARKLIDSIPDLKAVL